MKYVIKLFCMVMLLISCKKVEAQIKTDLKWFNPIASTYPVVKGKYWQNADSANFYRRLPTAAQETVRKDVWDLAKNATGEYIDFFTNAGKIAVRYQITGYTSFDAMSKISLNGLDMYVQDISGNWHWLSCSQSFKDTISYTFGNIDPTIKIKRFRLYLPLHTNLKWLEIGVAKTADFKVEPVLNQNPMVFYGTSIIHGGSVSRHGLTWINMLGRRFDDQMINLGFSGSGTLDKPVIDLMNTIDAKLFVLDCQPNLLPSNKQQTDEIADKITKAVESLRAKHPKAPILLVEHSGSLPGVNLDTMLTKRHQRSSAVLSDTYRKLKQHVPYLYLLTAKEIGFTIESTVDGTHPNDFGMIQYANAYEKKILEIFRKK